MNIEKLEKLTGQIALYWDESEKKEATLKLLTSIKGANELEKKALSTLSWYIKNRWGESDSFIDVLSILNDVQNGIFHHEQVEGDDGAEVLDNDLEGKVFFLQAGHTVTGKGSGYWSPHAKDEKNEQKFWKARLLNVKSKLEARGAKVFMWDREEGIFGVHARRTRDLIKRRCPEAIVAVQGHWNAYEETSHGFEIIVVSKSGLLVGTCIAKRMKQRCPEMTARDYDGVREKSSGRGTAWLREVPPPAVILELFFASNPDEMSYFESDKGMLDLEWVIENGLADYALAMP